MPFARWITIAPGLDWSFLNRPPTWAGALSGPFKKFRKYRPGLAEDYTNAKFLAHGLGQVPGIQVDPVDTNIVYFDAVQAGFNAQEFCEAMSAEGIRFSRPINKKIRAVTHLDVSRFQIKRVLEIVQKVVTRNRG